MLIYLFSECIPKRCGRAVNDGLISDKDAHALLKIAKTGKTEQIRYLPTTSNPPSSLNDFYPNLVAFKSLVYPQVNHQNLTKDSSNQLFFGLQIHIRDHSTRNDVWTDFSRFLVILCSQVVDARISACEKYLPVNIGCEYRIYNTLKNRPVQRRFGWGSINC